jgi:hypothetical protein
MNGLSDSLTVGLVLALIFGALVFYLYTRIGQIEKRVSLTENILLDLKMATENTIMAMGTPQFQPMETVERVEPVSAPEPMSKDEVEEVAEEDFYKSVLEQAAKAEAPVLAEVPSSTKVEVNYEAMTLKELKDEAKRRGIKVPTNPHKRDLIGLLKGQGQGQVSVLEPVPGSSEGPLEEGFPVELSN